MKDDPRCTICFGRGWLIYMNRAEACTETITAEVARPKVKTEPPAGLMQPSLPQSESE